MRVQRSLSHFAFLHLGLHSGKHSYVASRCITIILRLKADPVATAQLLLFLVVIGLGGGLGRFPIRTAALVLLDDLEQL